MSAAEYVLSLLDPFDQRFPQPKLLDGSVTRSSGVRFRNVGRIQLNKIGQPDYILVLPGFSNTLAWYVNGDAFWSTPIAHPSHMGNVTDRGNVRRIRYVSGGVKLSLLNSSDDNEGYWEAIRIPYSNLIGSDGLAPVGEDGLLIPTDITAPSFTNLASYSTYQTGRLRDIHRFMFKLNSVNPDHDFKKPFGATPVNWNELYDEGFDCVLIKLYGRVDATVPSILQYDVVSNQEVEYKDDTALGRLMNNNIMVPNMNVLLDKTRFMLPAIQLA